VGAHVAERKECPHPAQWRTIRTSPKIKETWVICAATAAGTRHRFWTARPSRPVIEWPHSGHGGRCNLRDLRRTSGRDGGWGISGFGTPGARKDDFADSSLGPPAFAGVAFSSV